MPDLDIDAIEARANAATPEPWKVNRLNGMGVDKVLASINGVGTAGFDDGWPNGDREVFRSEWEPNAGADADFIAAARADIPALVAEVRRLRAENNRLANIHPCCCEECVAEEEKTDV